MPSNSSAAKWLVVTVPALVGAVVSLLIVLSLAGKLRPVEVPAEYGATYVQENAVSGS